MQVTAGPDPILDSETQPPRRIARIPPTITYRALRNGSAPS